MSKGKKILSQAVCLLFRILCRMDIYFKSLMISQSGITMKHLTCYSSSQSSLKLILSVFKKKKKKVNKK